MDNLAWKNDENDQRSLEIHPDYKFQYRAAEIGTGVVAFGTILLLVLDLVAQDQSKLHSDFFFYIPFTLLVTLTYWFGVRNLAHSKIEISADGFNYTTLKTTKHIPFHLIDSVELKSFLGAFSIKIKYGHHAFNFPSGFLYPEIDVLFEKIHFWNPKVLTLEMLHDIHYHALSHSYERDRKSEVRNNWQKFTLKLFAFPVLMMAAFFTLNLLSTSKPDFPYFQLLVAFTFISFFGQSLVNAICNLLLRNELKKRMYGEPSTSHRNKEYERRLARYAYPISFAFCFLCMALLIAL